MGTRVKNCIEVNSAQRFREALRGSAQQVGSLLLDRPASTGAIIIHGLGPPFGRTLIRAPLTV
jgi:hypothetical protein